MNIYSGVCGKAQNEDRARVAELFRAFRNTSRVRIMAELMRGEANVSGLSRATGIRGFAVSHHMRGLRQMHPVSAHKSGSEVHYGVDNVHVVHAFRNGVKHIQDE